MYKSFLKIFILLQSFVFSFALCNEQEFSTFNYKYNKNYNLSEYKRRYNIFCKNNNFINNYNEHSPNLKLEMNKFGDMDSVEFKNYNSFKMNNNNYVKNNYVKNNYVKNLKLNSVPDSLDWRDIGMVTKVKDQGQCGSCWAFSAIASLESVNAIHGNHKLYNLSEQELVDCSTDYGNLGCGGGLMDNAFEYMMKYGIASDKVYSYNASDNACNINKTKPLLNVSRYYDVPKNNEKQLMYAVVGNPVSVAIDASDPTFQFYKSGIYNISDCGNNLDHGVTVVGYGKDNIYKLDYWIVKNSWNTDWGYNGYIYMRRNHETPQGMCGIAMGSSYPAMN